MGNRVPLHLQPNQDKAEGSELKATPLWEGKAWGNPQRQGRKGPHCGPTTFLQASPSRRAWLGEKPTPTQNPKHQTQRAVSSQTPGHTPTLRPPGKSPTATGKLILRSQ